MQTITKGSKVVVRTINGGELQGTLYETYRETYDLVLVEVPAPIAAGRIKEIQAI